MTEPLTLGQALATLIPTPRLVVLMCGVAGSGKTSFAQALEANGFRRLSIDEEIWDRFGRYGVDYGPEDYGRHVAAARSAVRDQLAAHLAAGREAVVVDSSFWSQAHRKDFKHLVEAAGGTWRLIYLDAPEAVLRERLAAAPASTPTPPCPLTRRNCTHSWRASSRPPARARRPWRSAN